MEFYYENWCLESVGSQCQEVDKTCYWVSSFIEPLDSLKDLKLIHILLSTLSHIRSRMSQQTPTSTSDSEPYWIEFAGTPSRNIFAKHHPSKTSFQHSHVVLLHAACCSTIATARSSLLALLLFHCEVHCRPSKHKQCRSHMRNGYNRFSAWSKYFIYWSKYFCLLLPHIIWRWWDTGWTGQWSGIETFITRWRPAGPQPELSFILSPLRNLNDCWLWQEHWHNKCLRFTGTW